MSINVAEDVNQNQPLEEENVSIPATKTAKVTRKHTRFFDSYINRILKNVSDCEITSNARQQLNSVLVHFARICAKHSFDLTEISKKKTISVSEIKGAIELMLVGELKTYSIDEGINAVVAYDTEMCEKSESFGKKTKSRQNKAGIIFPPSVIERFLRHFGYIKVMITANAPVFLASAMEYFASQILEGASKISTNNGKVRITVRDLEIAVNTDNELRDTFQRNHMSFVGGGVVPHIHPFLLKRVKNPGARHGNTALKEISRYQKTGDCLMFARHPFEMIVREVCNTIKPGMKISKDVFVYLQYIIEQHLVSILQMANNIAVYSKRLKVFPMDIEMVIAIQNNRMPKFLENLSAEAPFSSENIQIDMNKVDEESENDPLSDSEDEDELSG